MKLPRASTLIIAILSIVLLACLGFLGFALVNNYFLKIEAKRYASTVGIEQAERNFARGQFFLYEIKPFRFNYGPDDSGTVPNEGDIEPTGKTEGQLQVFYFLVNQDMPQCHLEIQQTYVDGYNERMRLFFTHPEWFDKKGQRLPIHNSNQQTNSSRTSI